MIEKRLEYLVLSFSLMCLAGGCERHKEQYVIEDRSAWAIIRLLSAYELEHPGMHATNLLQLVPSADGYPHHWHQQFTIFGKDAGFTNSIYEKYVFFPPGITSSWIRGELFMMNARPFPGPHGLERKVFLNQRDAYWYVTMSEDVVRRVFKETGIAEPKPIPMPPPPPAPIQEQYRESFSDILY